MREGLMLDTIVGFLISVTGDNAVLMIISLTVAVRTALLPLAVKQARAARVRERLAPKLQDLHKRHGRNRERLAKELNALYAKEGTSPFAGIGPALAQAPFLFLVYQIATHPTALAGHTLFGAPLGHQVASLVTGFGLFSWPVLVFVVVLILLAAVAWYTARKFEGPKALRLLPFASVAVALFTPFAVGLYLLVSTSWTAGERAVLATRPL
jgi:YidC/Oxa1 family membrane protein insertase